MFIWNNSLWLQQTVPSYESKILAVAMFPDYFNEWYLERLYEREHIQL